MFRRQPGVAWWFSGLAALLLIGAFTVLPFLAMLREAGAIPWMQVVGDPYLQRVVTFSLWQATLSTVLSLSLALPVALSLAHMPRFAGRRLIVALFSLSLVIPAIVAIYGIVAVFGRTGWISGVLSWLSFPPLQLYGLQGILLAHVFFNMPLAARVLLICLEGVPHEQWRLAAQLGLRPLNLFRFIEWPAIRSQLPSLALLIFTLCFTSFAIVMTLGGGPRATTIEVAIYQALRFDFDIGLSVALACVQLIICVVLMMLSTLIGKDANVGFKTIYSRSSDARDDRHQFKARLWNRPTLKICHCLILLLAGSLVVLPLAALFISSVNSKTLSVLLEPSTLSALRNTTITAIAAAVIAVTLALSLLISARYLRVQRQSARTSQYLLISGNVILVLPPLVLGTGMFLLLRQVADVFSLALLLVVVINSLMALPFALRILDAPFMRIALQSDKLIRSLGIRGIARWRLIDWPQIRRPLAFALALSATLSAGDLSAIALFGSERATTLPLLLYQRMGSYRLEEAAVTAGLLLVFCLLLFAAIQQIVGGSLRAQTR